LTIESNLRCRHLTENMWPKDQEKPYDLAVEIVSARKKVRLLKRRNYESRNG